MKCDRVEKCEHCTEWFVPKYRGKIRFCSVKCDHVQRRRKALVGLWRQCGNCYNLFTVLEDKDKGLRCSKQCKKPKQEPILSAIVYAVCRFGCGDVRTQRDNRSYSCEPCKREWARLESAKYYKPANDNHDRSSRPCKECKVEFIPVLGDYLRTFCSGECRTRYGRRVGKAARKARLRGAVIVAFDPITVLERDGWRCYICGVDTPRILRGTYEPNAPELDHVIALANGGAHTPENTACACRQCNALKSDNDNYIPTSIAA